VRPPVLTQRADERAEFWEDLVLLLETVRTRGRGDMEGTTPVGAVEGAVQLPEVGQFSWDPTTDAWWWSDGLYRLYGYEPGAVEPSLERFLQHKDPRDMARIDAVFGRTLAEGGPFSCYHRIVDAHGVGKTVVAVGFGTRDARENRTVLMQGFLVDVSTSTQQETEATLQQVLRTRAGIEQVKGALMLLHGLDADGAFAVLRGYSSIYNRKLSTIVSSVLEAFQQRDSSESVRRSELDRMLWDAVHPTEG
jgi:hypothetical protein